MTVRAFLINMVYYLMVIPAGVMCYLPMKNQLRYPRKKITTFLICAGLIYFPLCALIQLYFHLSSHIIIIFSLIPLFPLFYSTVKTDIPRAMAIYLNACTMMTFAADFAFLFDARLHPKGGFGSFSPEASLFQFGCALLLLVILAVPLGKYFSRIVDRLNTPKIWYIFIALPTDICFIFLYLIPVKYETLYVNRIFSIYTVALILTLLLYLFLGVLIYHTTMMLLRHSELEQRAKVLSMQATQYQSLLQHMEQQKQLRHDFRQTIHVLSALAAEGDLDKIKEYLKSYEESLETSSPRIYCTSPALNALFNYYQGMADSWGVKTRWQLSLPDVLTISELDLVSLLGNLMENAIAGCLTISKEGRYFNLSTEVRHGSLYIVSTNSFDGKVRKGDKGYLSTKRSGDGIGLYSIAAIAEKNHGITHISNSESEFFVDVMLKL